MEKLSVQSAHGREEQTELTSTRGQWYRTCNETRAKVYGSLTWDWRSHSARMPTRSKYTPTSGKDAKIQLDQRDREGIGDVPASPPLLSSRASSFHSAALKTGPPIS